MNDAGAVAPKAMARILLVSYYVTLSQRPPRPQGSRCTRRVVDTVDPGGVGPKGQQKADGVVGSEIRIEELDLFGGWRLAGVPRKNGGSTGNRKTTQQDGDDIIRITRR